MSTNELAYHKGDRSPVWETPWPLFKELDAEFGFELDVCALPENTKCSRFYSPTDNGLEQDWKGVCWMNPPYGREIIKWMQKAYAESQQGATVVCLLPSRTDTRWWHDYAMKGEIRFLRGRISFVGSGGPAPFPSVIVVFRPQESPC